MGRPEQLKEGRTLHFVTGGAYNGKTKWVKQLYGLENDVLWLSGYRKEQPELIDFQGKTVVLQGLDAWVQQDAEMMDSDSIRKRWKEIMADWRIWEKERDEHNCIVIGSDISKGIVPMEARDRRWRDACGWVFQDVASISRRVDIIWYGMNQRIK
ncbi:bifunctional adenosylcobinamide kinase/adenosylcobinamide-phosphate guanylyltransferase [Peribacillus simplex]|uniref:Adenosylcobinamide kinase n=1 Tax=Peribacillus simplex TaxID=1478 RepID=A0AA90P0D1_9BACI|nr:bifunctional adenosylcobinamide kinase/adenosylcobinamide-phosphate guanylyltransferase [Peribacillus simplex]MDP1418553.1 bifunctional adenosylcobinamide kinase/adenosylcobinamide-phosphate guanylyltransferase [Peribacillus simplex]